MDSNVKLSNVIGAPFSDYVLLQLYIRAARNSTVNRTNEEVLFLANKTAWARLVSSVNIHFPASETNKVTQADYQTYYSQFNLNSGLPYNAPDSLAKNWILEAGTSIQDGNGIALRSGVGPDGAYGLGGTEELGYRPMPGLTGVTVETTGRLGSLRQATINFKVWNMNQLNAVEALYFRLGYSMLLEWGHTQYFDNKNNFERTGIYGIDDPFASGQRKELIQQAIALKARNSFGNYDGMLGIVSNFSWSMNQDGGYDCTVKLVGLGSVMDSMRINQAYKLPDGLLKEYKRNKSALEAAQQAYIAALEKKVKDLQNPPATSPTGSTIDPTPKSPAELRQRLQTYNNYQKFTVNDVQADYGIPAFYKTESFTAAKASGSYDYYTTFDNVTATNVKDKVITNYAGLWLNHQGTTGWVRIPTTGIDSAVIDTTLLNIAAENITYQTAEGPKTASQLGLTGGTFVSKIFDYDTRTYITNIGGEFTNTVEVPLTSPLNVNATEANYLITGLKSPSSGTTSTFFNIKAKVSKTAQDVNFQPTRQELIKLLDLWQSQNTSEVKDVKVTQTGNNKVLISGTFKGEVIASYSGTPGDKANVIRGNSDSKAQEGGTKRLVPVIFEFTTDNPGFISKVGPATNTPKVTPQTTQTANTGDTNGSANQANTSQTDAVESFASALQAMLTVIQTQAQKLGSEKPNTVLLPVSIKSQTEKFFQDGIMNGVLNPSNTPEATADLSNSKFNLVQYASKGFNSQLMIDPTLYNNIPTVNFDVLCKAFLIRYAQGGEDQSLSLFHAPVYIQFGYLLAFLNNMCLIYDSPESKIPTNNNAKKGTPKRPYVYIDFNPETNFCLTSPQQLSVDPYTCLIPLDGDEQSYKQIFPENLRTKIPNLFNPGSKANIVSGGLHGAGLYYKSEGIAYQGKVMNILLNVDYLLQLTKDFAGSDPQHAVRLEPFLNRILTDINKALGNTNAFRVAYRDDSNTIQIQDDQWVPSLIGEALSESSVLAGNEYNSKLKTDPKYAGLIPISGDPKELPVVGNLSLARQFQLRSVMSTKLASMIAISAQAATGSVNATDHSSLSYLNQNFQDRYKPYIQNASNGDAGSNTTSKNKDGESNDQKAAELFNDHVKSIYSTLNLSANRVDLAKNYYIERMSEVKSGDVITSAAPFIPAELEMTLDGISGIIMGNAFTVPQDRLPLSLRGENGLAKIAFIVTGLTHTIQNNEWLTKIKGQMIKLRQETKIPAAKTIISQIQDLTIETSNRATNIINTTPWSAAFISYVMQRAGVSDFPSNATHTGYAQSLRNTPGDFLILNPTKYRIQPGDIIIRNRDGNTLTFDSVTWDGYSHGDIVVSIDGNTAAVIGGNISNTVYKSTVGLVDGRLGRSDYFVILRPAPKYVSTILETVIREYKLWNTNQWKELTPAALDTLRSYYKTVRINL